jgi:hypothetical protein
MLYEQIECTAGENFRLTRGIETVPGNILQKSSVAVNPHYNVPYREKEKCEDLDPGWNHVRIRIRERTSRIRKIGPTVPEKGSNAI